MFGNFFSNIKNKAISVVLQKQLKHLPKEQQEMIMKMVTENPDLFKKIGAEIEAKKKAGQNEMYAGIEVMRKYQWEIQKLMK